MKLPYFLLVFFCLCPIGNFGGRKSGNDENGGFPQLFNGVERISPFSQQRHRHGSHHRNANIEQLRVDGMAETQARKKPPKPPTPEQPAPTTETSMALIRKTVYEYVPTQWLMGFLTNKTETKPKPKKPKKQPTSFREAVASAMDFDYSPFSLIPEEREKAKILLESTVKGAESTRDVSTDTDGFIRIARPTKPPAKSSTTGPPINLNKPQIADPWPGDPKWSPQAVADSVANRFREEKLEQAAKVRPPGPGLLPAGVVQEVNPAGVGPAAAVGPAGLAVQQTAGAGAGAFPPVAAPPPVATIPGPGGIILPATAAPFVPVLGAGPAAPALIAAPPVANQGSAGSLPIGLAGRRRRREVFNETSSINVTVSEVDSNRTVAGALAAVEGPVNEATNVEDTSVPPLVDSSVTPEAETATVDPRLQETGSTTEEQLVTDEQEEEMMPRPANPDAKPPSIRPPKGFVTRHIQQF